MAAFVPSSATTKLPSLPSELPAIFVDASGRAMRQNCGLRTRRGRGFTLLELMNSLALITILSAVAMYGIARYLRHQKTLEAIGTVESLAAAAANFYDGSDSEQPAGTTPDAAKALRHFPPPSKSSVPADMASVKGTKYQSGLADWQGSPWRELRFTITLPQYYAYSFDSQGTGLNAFAVVSAHGDLDGNGVESTFTLKVTPDATFTARVAPAMDKTSPEE